MSYSNIFPARLTGPYFAGSVRARLVRFAVLLLVPGFAISALLTWRVFVTEREGAEIALRETARGLGQVVDREFAEAEMFLRTLAATDELARGDMAAFDRLARAMHVMGGTVVMTDGTGQELIDTGLPSGSKLPRMARPGGWDAEQPGEIIISSLERLPHAPGLGIRIVLPIKGARQPGQAGYRYDLALVVPPASFQAILLREKLPASWIAAVLDDEATVVARTVAAEHFLGLPVRPGLKQALAATSDGVRESQSLEGTPVVAAFQRSPLTKWVAVVNAPRLLINAAGRQSTLMLVWLGSVAMVLGWLGALHVARGIAGRIEAMAKAARSLGDTETWTPVPRGLDEVDTVAEAMHTAATALIERREALSDLNATLAARVEARTAELAAANRAIEEQRRQLRTILDQMPVGVVVHGPDDRMVFANLEARRLLGLASTGEVAQDQWPTPRRGAAAIVPEQLPWVLAAKGHVTERELMNVEREGAQLDLEVNASPLLRDADGGVVLSVTTLQDVTARLQAEEARRRSQRLEAVGQLTGGVAHEFNNLLMAISGCLELLGPFVQDGRGPRLLANAARATERGGRLTRQLLAFSRRQHLQPEPVDLNSLVSGMTELLESTLGRLVEVATTLDEDAWTALADVPQLELVLLNLAINARDAMPGGGRLTICTSNRQMGPPLRPEDPPAGEFAVLTVADTGHGMAAPVLARVFEPFFTTKDIGLGSGLGLPQVLGVAQQLGGGVSIASHPGHGTIVEVFLPRAQGEPKRVSPADQGGSRSRLLGGSHLLVVDDDADVREIARDMLEEMGAVVQEAENAGAALLLLRTSRVDLVLADLTMPHVSGIELARHIADFLPDIPVVLMTGYGAAALDVSSPNIRATLQKPFRAEALAKSLAEALGRDAVPAM